MRTLVENYFVSTQPAGWRCSECGLVFVAKDHHGNGDVPSEILRRFEDHSCKSHLTQRRLEVVVNKTKAHEKRSDVLKEQTVSIMESAKERSGKTTAAVQSSKNLITKSREAIEMSKARRRKNS